jgi:hypothetical protein
MTSKTSTVSSSSEYRLWEASGIDLSNQKTTPKGQLKLDEENVNYSIYHEEGNVRLPHEMLRSPKFKIQFGMTHSSSELH